MEELASAALPAVPSAPLEHAVRLTAKATPAPVVSARRCMLVICCPCFLCDGLAALRLALVLLALPDELLVFVGAFTERLASRPPGGCVEIARHCGFAAAREVGPVVGGDGLLSMPITILSSPRGS